MMNKSWFRNISVNSNKINMHLIYKEHMCMQHMSNWHIAVAAAGNIEATEIPPPGSDYTIFNIINVSRKTKNRL